MMNCPSDTELHELVAGKLEPERFEALCIHLEQCPECQLRVSNLHEPDDSFIQSLGDVIEVNKVVESGGKTGKATIDDLDLGSHLLTTPCEIRNYKINRFLGMGGMGEVYEGEHLHFQRPIALKLIQRVKQNDPVFQKQFFEEISCLGRLTHPNLVVAYDAWQEENRLFLVMEFIDGSSLSAWLKERSPSLASMLFVMKQLLQGIGYLHEKGFLHRDLKPSNVMIGRDEKVKIIDLGLARSMEVTENAAEMVAGTRKYMAPEQLRGEAIDQRIDIYAAGQILKQMLSALDPTELSSAQTWLRSDLVRIAEKMTADSKADRYASVCEPLREIFKAEKAANSQIFWRRMRWIAVFSILLLFVSLIWIYGGRGEANVSDKAELWVTNASPYDEMVMVNQRGHRTLLPLGNSEVHTIEPGTYEMELVFPNNRRLIPESLTFRSGRRHSIAVEPIPTTEITGTLWRKSLVYPINMELVTVPTGVFTMGGVESDPHMKPSELPRRTIKIEKPFQIGAFEVTVGQFAEFVDATGYRTYAESSGKGGWIANRGSSWGENKADVCWHSPGYTFSKDYPVTAVTYEDCVAFCTWLSQRDKKKYRLPSEIEWEYACRAGAESVFPFSKNARDQYAWNLFNTKASLGPRIVGSRSPNSWGIYDMIGNVREWCLDYYSASAFELSYQTHQFGPDEGTLRCVRGGGFMDTDPFLRSSFRGSLEPRQVVNNQGFRVVCVD